MATNVISKGFAKAKPFVKETIEWNKLTTIIATIVVLFFFTRSAPFPSTTFWELTIARDFSFDTNVLYPETIALKVEDSSLSLLGLKAIYHVIYFIICSLFCIWIFRNKEPLPGLVTLSIFAFSMQVFLNLRMLLTILFIMCMLFLLDQRLMQNKFGFVFIPIMAAASGLGLNTPLLISLIASYCIFNKNYRFSLVFCALLGGFFFPEGFVSFLKTDSIFNWNFIPESELRILYVLSGLFLLFNLVSLPRMSSQDFPLLVFYAITGFFSLLQPTTIPVFITFGLFFFIKLYSDLNPLPLIFQMLGLLLITTMVYLYLFINPFGIKLNPSVKNQLGKELAPLEDGFYDRLEIEKYNLGELIWKPIITCDQDKIKNLLKKDKLILTRTPGGEYRIKESNIEEKTLIEDQLHKEIDF